MKKEKARPIAPTMEQASGKEILAGTNLSQNDFTTPAGREQGPVERLLLHGQENAQSAPELAKLAGMRSMRELQLQIARERAAGALILSSCRGKNSGYYLPGEGTAGRLELSRYVASMMRRGTRCMAAALAAREALRQVEGQTDLWEKES